VVTSIEDLAVDIEDASETHADQEISLEEDSPMSITIHSKGHDPIQITLNKSKPNKRPRLS